MEDHHTGKTSGTSLSENDLVALLATLRKEATPEANFEERFLYDFHERVAREAVCRPARTLLWEHIRQFLSNLGRRKLAYSASTLGAGVLALGLYSLQDDSDSAAHKVAAARGAVLVNQMEDALEDLKYSGEQGFDAISVGESEDKSFGGNRLSVSRNNSAFASLKKDEGDVIYVSSSRPVNMGLPLGMDSDFPTLTTNVAF